MAATFDVNDVALRDGLANIGVNYKNEGAIWDQVAPVVRVSQRSGKYRTYDEASEFNIPDDTLSDLAKANEITLSHADSNYSVNDHGLAAYVPQSTIDEAQADSGDLIDPLGRAEMLIRQQLSNKHEKRVADVAFAAGTYASGYKTTLSGTSQWSHASSFPISAIIAGLDIPLQRPNTLILGSDVWKAMRTHAQVVSTIYPMGGNAASGGLPTANALLEALRDEGITKVLIGRSRINTANPGQTPSYSRVWGKLALAAYIDPNPTPDSFTFMATFAETLSNPTIAFDEQMGVKGAYRVQDTWNEDVVLVASKAAYLWVDAVA